MTKEEIIAYKTTNQIKIYKLNQIGLSSSEIAQEMQPLFKPGDDSKRVYYVNSILKEFQKDKSKIEKANKIPD